MGFLLPKASDTISVNSHSLWAVSPCKPGGCWVGSWLFSQLAAWISTNEDVNTTSAWKYLKYLETERCDIGSAPFWCACWGLVFFSSLYRLKRKKNNNTGLCKRNTSVVTWFWIKNEGKYSKLLHTLTLCGDRWRLRIDDTCRQVRGRTDHYPLC